MTNRRDRLATARIYLVCADQDDDFLDAALRGGVDIVQLRMKPADDDAVARAGERFRRITDRHGALLIINDRPELVSELGADGAHVGQEDMPTPQARSILGPDRLLGLSTHTRSQIDAAARAEVDYIGVGPVHETPTKAGRPAVGVDLVRYAARRAPVPFFAIGGIASANVETVRRAGARRIAVVRALTQATDPEQMARRLRRQLTEPVEAPVGAT